MVQSVKKELTLSLPQRFEDILLLCPGVWNGLEYNSQEINNAFLNTDWNNKSNTHLYLDHQDTQEKGVSNWAGFIKNPRMVEGELRGDLEVWDESTARFLKEAEAKFGVSATLAGLEDENNNSMRNFHFESFSIVTNPACKPAWINLSQDEGLRKIRAISKMYGIKILKEDLDNNLPNNSTSLGGNQLNKGVNMEKKNLEEEKATEEEEKKESEESSEESKEEVVENQEEEEKSTEEDEEESNEESSEELSSNDLLKELNSKFDKLLESLKPLAHSGDYGQGEGGPIKKAKNPKKPRLLDSGMEEINKQLSEIKEQLVEGNSRDVTTKRMTLAVSDSLVPDKSTDADHGMLEFLQRRI